jgi:transposase
MDRNRKGEKLFNKDWKSSTDTDSRIAKIKDGHTRLAYKPEHAVDLNTGAACIAE